MVPGLDTAETSPALALGALLGGTPSTDKVTYGTEAGLFQAAGIETVVCGPGDIQQAHAPDEFIELDQILACEALVDRLVQHLTAARHERSHLVSTSTTSTLDVSTEERSRVRGPWSPRSVGNALEWFDIIVYASFAVVISKLFFPDRSPAPLGLLLTFGTFAISYLDPPDRRHGDRRRTATGRPQEGPVADDLRDDARHRDHGVRRPLPPPSAPGPASSSSSRGCSRASRPVASSARPRAFLIENAPNRKAFYASWQVATQGSAMFLASAFGFGLNTWLTQDQLESWGWRIPFVFGLLIGPVGLYIRTQDGRDAGVRPRRQGEVAAVADASRSTPARLLTDGGVRRARVHLGLPHPLHADVRGEEPAPARLRRLPRRHDQRAW